MTEPADTVLLLAGSVAPVLPSPWAFSHFTAARMLGLPLPVPWAPDEQLHVLRPSGESRVRRAGVVGHRGLESRELTSVRGMPVTTSSATWLDLASELSVEDLVVVGDVIARRQPGALRQLRSQLLAGRVRRGRRRAVEALSSIRPGSRSPMETRTWLAFLSHGLPEPELNAPVHDASGEWTATVDFVWRKERIIAEYEGDQHRADRRQWQADLTRQRLLEALGWRVLRITALDLEPDRVADTVGLVADALAGRDSSQAARQP